MKLSKFSLFFFSFFFSISLISALSVDIPTYESAGNFSFTNVNSSDYWDNLDTPADFLLSMFSPTWVDTTLDMNSNIIENVLNLYVVGNTTIGESLDIDGRITTNSLIVNQSSLSDPVIIRSTDSSKNLSFYHDNGSPFTIWSGDSYVFKNMDADSNTIIDLRPDGTGNAAYRIDAVQMFQWKTGSTYVESIPGAEAGFRFFVSSAEGETKQFRLYGYRTGDAIRHVRMSIGGDADNTMSFKNIGNYYFDGNIGIETATPTTALDVKGSVNVSGGNDLWVSDDVFITDDVEIGGDTLMTGNLNQTNGNATIEMVYAEVWGKDIGDITLTEDVYKNISNMTNSKLNGFTYDNNHTLYPQFAGMYSINSAYAFSGTANQEYHLSFAVNGERIENCHTRRVIGTGGDVGSASITCLCPVEAGDYINIQIENVDSSGDATIYDINLNMVRIAS